MYTEKLVRLLAGSLVLISLVLGLYVNKYWFILTAFVGLNLVQSVFTNFCLAETIFKKLGAKEKAEYCKAKEHKAPPD